MRTPSPYFLGLTLLATSILARDITPWKDITSESGLGQNALAQLKFANLNSDQYPDIVMLPHIGDTLEPIVFLQRNSGSAGITPTYKMKTNTGLPVLQTGDVMVFADLDNDGHQDAIIGRYLDIYQEDYKPPESPATRTSWMKGIGDGSFSEAIPLTASQLATTRAIAVGDVNEDGLPDLFLGNWYEKYFSGYEGFANDLLLQYTNEGAEPSFVRWPIPHETSITSYDKDLGGRPTYGVVLPRLDDGLPMLLELNYGRRWNRLYQLRHRPPLRIPEGYDLPPSPVLKDNRAQASCLIRNLQGENIAAEVHVDGDNIRHGRHPHWPRSHSEAQPRSKRSDEPPFRANGNTFDAAIGDIDNDGDFDLFVSTIIHAWAGESSDRSRFLVNQLQETGELDFLSFDYLSVDRIPDPPAPGAELDPVNTNFNQGDIFAELADLNNDGHLDLILCSSDYPDPPPYDERLRIYFQQSDGRFLDVTHELGVDHVGAGMPSLADVDGDGDLDVLVGQSFNRLPAAQRRAAAIESGALPVDAAPETRPRTRARLFKNESSAHRQSIMLDLVGDPTQGCSRNAFGTIIRLTADLDGDPSTPDIVQSRQVLGPGGHAGKQSMLTVHFGLGEAVAATVLEVIWSGSQDDPTVLESVPAGHYQLKQASPTLHSIR